MNFDSQGRFIGLSGKPLPKEEQSTLHDSGKHNTGRHHTDRYDRDRHYSGDNYGDNSGNKAYNCETCGRPISHRGNCLACNIRNKRAEKAERGEKGETDEDFLGEKLKKGSDKKKESPKKYDNSKDTKYWSLYKNGEALPPLRFSNGKTQEDVVREVVELVKRGKKIIFLHGVCGTGKSAIALNIARVLGRAAIVVPVKNLQKQYEEDYTEKMYLLNSNGEKLNISMITGKSNHDSIFDPGIPCSDPFLPDNIQIIEKNFKKIKEYYRENPLIQNQNLLSLHQIKRVSIAPTNPYWSPIIPSRYKMNLPDAEKKTYKGLNDTEFIFYHRKRGCSYYDQYEAYFDSDVIIFNAAKYKIETAMNRKPVTNIDIIDEADEFLDSFSNQSELNLTRLKNSLSNLYSEDHNTMDLVDEIIKLISLEEKNKRATGVDENQIFRIDDTNIKKILDLISKDENIGTESYFDDSSSNYVSKAIGIAKDFEDFFKDTYLTYRTYEGNLIVNLVTTDMSKRLQEVLDKNRAFVFMSGTLHSESILKNVFGIKEYETVEAETIPPGIIEISRTGMEFDCKYDNFSSGNKTRKHYLEALSACLQNTLNPTLVQVNAFNDLPSEKEISDLSIKSLISREKLIELQNKDRTGKAVSEFKLKLFDTLYSTKCSRGVDFPGDTCHSVLFTKYPNPNPKDTFWKILKKTHPQYFWDFYKDKARRELLQRLYRALRSPKDHVFVLSPDSRVLEAVRELQVSGQNP
jgi:Rad3-related DNA helicase